MKVDPRALRRFRSHRGALVGTGIVLFLVLFALFAPWLGLDPLTSDFSLIAAPETMGFLPLAGMLLIAGVLVASVGSGLSLRRFLRV